MEGRDLCLSSSSPGALSAVVTLPRFLRTCTWRSMWKEKSGISGVTFAANVLFGALLSYIILLCVVT